MEGSALVERPSSTPPREGRSPFFVDFPFQREAISEGGAAALAKHAAALTAKGFDPVQKGDLKLTGYASTWVLDRDGEYIAKRAFDKSLPAYLANNPILLWQHQRDKPVGQVLSGETDDTGLGVSCWHRQPTQRESDWKHDAFQSVKAGIVQTFSIGGFFDREIVDGEILIVNVDLMELSEVSIPSNPISLFSAAQKAAKGMPLKEGDRDDPLVLQMLQLQGMIPMTDSFLRALDQEDSEAYYGRLAVQFQGQKGQEAPPLNTYREVEGGMDSRTSEETLKQVRELTELFALPDVEPQPSGEVTVEVEPRGAAPEAKSAPGEKRGRIISSKNERKLASAVSAMHEAADALTKAAEGVDEVLAQVREDEGDDQRSVPHEVAAALSQHLGDRKQLASDVRSLLSEAGTERWGKKGTYVWVDDFDVDEQWAVYMITSDSDERCVRVSFSRDKDGGLSLGTQETEVRRTTSYAPA